MAKMAWPTLPFAWSHPVMVLEYIAAFPAENVSTGAPEWQMGTFMVTLCLN